MRVPSRSSLFLYVFKEALPYTGLAFFILTTLVFIQQAGKYPEITLSLETSSVVTRSFLLSLFPGIVIITLPVSLLLGTVIACSRLSSDNELVAAQSLGVSKLTLAAPFFLLGILGTGVTIYLSAKIAPASLKRLKSLRAEILLQEAQTRIKPHTFITSFPDLLLYVQNVDPKTGDWLGVFLIQNDSEKGLSKLVTAERGQFRATSTAGVKLEADLSNVISLEQAPAKGPAPTAEEPAATESPRGQGAAFVEKLSFKLIEQEESDVAAAMSPLNEMSLTEVARAGAAAKTRKEKLQAVTEWNRRFAFPFACLVLTLITFVTSVQGKRFSTRPRTVIALLFVAMGYYLLQIVGQNLSVSGKLPPWLGVWSANIAGGLWIAKSLFINRSLLPFASRLPSLSTFFSSRGSSPAAGRAASARAGGASGDAERLSGKRSFQLGAFNLINYLVVSEIVKYYLIAVTSLVVTSVIFTLFDLVPAIIKNGTSLPYAFSYLGYLAPQLAYYVSPFAFLVALLMGFSVLSRSNQLVILAAAGQSRFRILSTAFAIAVAIGGTLWLLSNLILPFTNREQDVRYHKIKGKQLEQTTIAFGRKWVYGKNHSIYSYQRIENDNTLINASIYRLTADRGLLDNVVHFTTAAQTAETSWLAANGWRDAIRPNASFERISLSEHPLTVPIEDGAGLFKRTVNESTKMSAWGLQEYIAQLKSIGVSTLDLQIDLNKRLAFPFSCLTLSVLAIPFITIKQGRRSSPLMSVAISVCIGLVFWLLMTLFEAAGKQSTLPATIAVWAPQILFGAIGLFLIFFRHRTQ
ncbi:MAG: LptF/LptG family permease [Blastocatellia bacterium]|nr:LptF/LptG family permease [Blastocatellia bacterium]